MTSLLERFAQLKASRQQSLLPSTPVSPSRQASSTPNRVSPPTRQSTEELSDLTFSPAPVTTPAPNGLGRRRRENSPERSTAEDEFARARQAQLDRERAYARERLQREGLADLQSQIDLDSFVANPDRLMLIDMRVEQMVGLKRLDQVIASVVASKPETQETINMVLRGLIHSPNIPVYVTGVFGAVCSVAQKNAYLFSLPASVSDDPALWKNITKGFSRALTGARSQLREKLYDDYHLARGWNAKKKRQTTAKKTPLLRLANSIISSGRSSKVPLAVLGRVALLRKLFSDHQAILLHAKQGTKQITGTSVEGVDGVGLPDAASEPGAAASLGDDESENAPGGGLVEDGELSDLELENPEWGPGSFWNYVDWSFAKLRREVKTDAASPSEAEEIMSMFITDTLQKDLKDYPASKAGDKIVTTPGFDTNDDRPMFIKLLEESVIKCLDV